MTRLNAAKRKAIIANISDAYDKKLPAPEVVDTREGDLKEAVIAEYRKQIIPFTEALEREPVFEPVLRARTDVKFYDPNGWTYHAPIVDSQGKSEKLLDILHGGYFMDLRDTGLPADIQKVIDANEKAKKSIRKQREAFSAWLTEKRKYLISCKQALTSVTTIKKLLIAWPEVREFLPQEDTPVGTALSVNVAALNEVLGLPTEK